jgi:prepilin-type N-terminal cleavage/methylation domain-containing protein
MKRLYERLRRDDGGFTLIEMVVTLVIMGVVMILVTGAINQIYNAEQKTEATSDAQSQVLQAFQRLDKGVRYASAISTQTVYAGDPTVEYQTSYNGTPTCTELRLNVVNHVLQQRIWTNVSPIVLGPWVTIASEISAATFTTITPGTPSSTNPNVLFQQLRVQLTSRSGTNATATSKSSDITFTGLNTSSSSVLTVCTDQRGVAW